MKISQQDLLNPYCRFCGLYKGIGPCTRESCKSKWIGKNEHTSFSRPSVECVVCGKQATVICSHCGRTYCPDHFINKTLHSVNAVEDHLALCGICGRPVCEYCWILDEEKSMICFWHM